MLSQLKLNTAVAAATIFCLFSGLGFAADSRSKPSLVKGAGLPRSERDCLAELPAFTQRISRLGLKPIKPVECEEVLGETDSFQPVFTASSAHPATMETALGAIYSSIEGCELNLKSILNVVADESETVIETACVEVSVAEQETDEMSVRNFQPTVILLKHKNYASTLQAQHGGNLPNAVQVALEPAKVSREFRR